MDVFSVERDASGYYTICSGDRYQGNLDQGEALYLIACLLLGKGDPMKMLRTKEEHAAIDREICGYAQTETEGSEEN